MLLPRISRQRERPGGGGGKPRNRKREEEARKKKTEEEEKKEEGKSCAQKSLGDCSSKRTVHKVVAECFLLPIKDRSAQDPLTK